MNKQRAVVAALLISLASQADAQDGSSCAGAIHLYSNMRYTSDTTSASNWMTSFGPLVSPSNDRVYEFTAGPQPIAPLTPTFASYSFAMYLIPSCDQSGTEPVPIGATATVGTAINLSKVLEGHTYYVAVTGTAAGGPGANGTLNFFTGFLPVALQSFEID